MLHFRMLAQGMSVMDRMERQGAYLFISVASELKTGYVMFGDTMLWEEEWEKYV